MSPCSTGPTIRSASCDAPSQGGSRLVAIDGLDTLTGADRDQAAALLRDAAEALKERRGDARSTLTVVASARRDGPALDVLADAHRPSVTALALTARPTETPIDTQVISS